MAMIVVRVRGVDRLDRSRRRRRSVGDGGRSSIERPGRWNPATTLLCFVDTCVARAIALLALALVLPGCATGPTPAVDATSLLADSLFGRPREAVDTSTLFAADAAMRRYLEVDIAGDLRREGAQIGLANALRSRSRLRLDYDAARTKTASEAFATRSGNCLSLVVMTSALARELGVPVHYRRVDVEPSLSKSGELLVVSGHIDIVLGRRLLDARTGRDQESIVVDFLPPALGRRLRASEIAESTVVAMFANNRAAEALADGRIDAAYAWSAESLRHDPAFLPAVNTLGVVYLRGGHLAEAERAFAHVLERAPGDAKALANVAVTYERQGRDDEASRARARLAAVEPVAPFHFFALGLDAMRRGDARAARALFAREVAHLGSYHELHFWLAQADWQLGDVADAAAQLTQAIDASLTRAQQQLYGAKLAWLREQHRPAPALPPGE